MSLPAPHPDAGPFEFDNTFGRLPCGFYTRLQPTPLPDPYPVAFNPAAAELIGLDPAYAGTSDFVEIFSGNRVPRGADPLAAIYAGHQFGTYVPQLGDGRAILLGNVGNGFDGYSLAVLKGGSPADANNLYHADKLRLEEVNSYEVGYRAQLVKKLYIDLDYYYNTYNNFIATDRKSVV